MGISCWNLLLFPVAFSSRVVAAGRRCLETGVLGSSARAESGNQRCLFHSTLCNALGGPLDSNLHIYIYIYIFILLYIYLCFVLISIFMNIFLLLLFLLVLFRCFVLLLIVSIPFSFRFHSIFVPFSFHFHFIFISFSFFFYSMFLCFFRFLFPPCFSVGFEDFAGSWNGSWQGWMEFGSQDRFDWCLIAVKGFD